MSTLLSFPEIDAIIQGSKKLSKYEECGVLYVPATSDHKDQVYIKTWEYDVAVEKGLDLCLVIYPSRRMIFIKASEIQLAGVVNPIEYTSKYHYPPKTYRLVGFYIDQEKMRQRIQRKRDKEQKRSQLNLFAGGDGHGSDRGA